MLRKQHGHGKEQRETGVEAHARKKKPHHAVRRLLVAPAEAPLLAWEREGTEAESEWSALRADSTAAPPLSM